MAVEDGTEIPESIHPSVARLAVAQYLFRAQQFRAAYNALEPNIDASKGALFAASLKLLVDCLVADGDRRRALEAVAEFSTTNPGAASVLPISELISGRKWDELEVDADRLSLSIVIDRLWRRTNDDNLATFRRFAFDDFLVRNGLARPTELATLRDQFPPRQLVYFLRYVCVQSVMDMSLSFASSRELEEERREICRLLCVLDPPNNDTYQAEIYEITNRLVIQDGLKVVDSSRLHVDVEGITRWAEAELKELYFRYKDLVAAGVGVSDSFETILRNLWKEETAKNYFAVPESEADDLLIKILTTLRDQFLFDTSHGLDSYLSKRVRHGSIPNFLRSPVENASLITQRETGSNSYKPNIYWLSKLSNPSEEGLKTISRYFEEFSKEFDAIIIDLKDNLLQVRSADRPNGFFDIQLISVAYHLLRSVAQFESSFESFLKECYNVFWYLLEPSLAKTRSHLRVEVKTQIARAFDGLRASLLQAAGPNPELSMAIGEATAEVQRRADAIAEWFNRPEAHIGTHYYDLEQVVDISVESALNAMRSFKPKIDRTVSEGYRLPGNGLVIVAEIIWVALENVRLRSGLEEALWINIKADFRIEDEVLSIRIENPVSSDIKTLEASAKLESIRESIANGSFRDRVRREGNSGFFKIASVVSQSDRGRIEFGFAEADVFFLEVDLASILYSPQRKHSPEAAHANPAG